MKSLFLVIILSFMSFFAINYFYSEKNDMIKRSYIEREESMMAKYNIKSKIITTSQSKFEDARDEYEEKIAFLTSKEKELEDWQEGLSEKQTQKEIVDDEVELTKRNLADLNQLLSSTKENIRNEKITLANIKKKSNRARAIQQKGDLKKASAMMTKFYNLYYVNELKVAEACKSDHLNRKKNVGECKLAMVEQEAAKYLLNAIRLYSHRVKTPNKYQRFLRKHAATLRLVR